MKDLTAEFEVVSEMVASAAFKGDGEAFQRSMEILVRQLLDSGAPKCDVFTWATRVAVVFGMPLSLPDG